MAKRKKLKAAKLPPQKKQTVHDRRTTDLPYNAKVSFVEIPDPYATPEFPVEVQARRSTGELAGEVMELRVEPPPRLLVARAMRDDPLAAMHAKAWIDDVQYQAGRKWQEAHVRSEIGVVKAIDPTREAVDGGRVREPINQMVSKAMRDMVRATKALKDGDRLVRKVLGEGKTIVRAADEFGIGTKWGREQLGKKFRDCLDILAVVFGCANRRAA
jgi:hypothetical protein